MDNNATSLLDVTRSKEIFEYEMTQVLLQLKGEFSDVSALISNIPDIGIEGTKLEHCAEIIPEMEESDSLTSIPDTTIENFQELPLVAIELSEIAIPAIFSLTTAIDLKDSISIRPEDYEISITIPKVSCLTATDPVIRNSEMDYMMENTIPSIESIDYSICDIPDIKVTSFEIERLPDEKHYLHYETCTPLPVISSEPFKMDEYESCFNIDTPNILFDIDQIEINNVHIEGLDKKAVLVGSIDDFAVQVEKIELSLPYITRNQIELGNLNSYSEPVDVSIRLPDTGVSLGLKKRMSREPIASITGQLNIPNTEIIISHIAWADKSETIYKLPTFLPEKPNTPDILWYIEDIIEKIESR